MKIIIGGDHAGFALKQQLLLALEQDGHEITHVGCYTSEPVDFPDIAKLVCKAIINKDVERGIMVCGSGVGASIACNKISGIRACVVHDMYTAHQCVEHDNVQVMTIGAGIIGETLAKELINVFLNSKFSESTEFRRRVEKLSKMDGSAY